MTVARTLVSALTLTLAAALPAKADVTVTFVESGTDVLVSLSGSITLDGMTLADKGATTFARNTISPADGIVSIGAGPAIDNYRYPGSAVTPNFGTGFFSDGTSTTGGLFVFNPVPRAIGLPAGYVSGAPLQAQATFANASFASLGIRMGTTVYSWGSGPSANTVTVTAVPEPSTAALAAGGLLALAAVMRRRRRSAADGV